MSEKRPIPKEESEDFRVYTKRDNEHYSEKKNHRERTLGNDQRKKGHKEFWKKQEKKEKWKNIVRTSSTC